jgi:hypothetical protein
VLSSDGRRASRLLRHVKRGLQRLRHRLEKMGQYTIAARHSDGLMKADIALVEAPFGLGLFVAAMSRAAPRIPSSMFSIAARPDRLPLFRKRN